MTGWSTAPLRSPAPSRLTLAPRPPGKRWQHRGRNRNHYLIALLQSGQDFRILIVADAHGDRMWHRLRSIEHRDDAAVPFGAYRSVRHQESVVVLGVDDIGIAGHARSDPGRVLQ